MQDKERIIEIRQGSKKSAPLFNKELAMCYGDLDPKLDYRVPDATLSKEVSFITGKLRRESYPIINVLFLDYIVTAAACKQGSIENMLKAVKN